MIWNPFLHLQETIKYPESRVLRSSLRQRFIDTFIVFNGGVYENSNLGILDYLFPFARMSSVILSAINSSYPFERPTTFAISAKVTLLVLWSIPTIVLNIPKLVVSSMLTLALSPIISIFHICFMSKQNSLFNDINHLKIRPIKKNIDKSTHLLDEQQDFEEETELSSAFDSKEYETMSIRPISKVPAGSCSSYSEYAKPSSLSLAVLLGLFAPNPSSNRLGKPLAIININTQNSKSIKALLTTNMFKVTNSLEDNEILTQVVRDINRRHSI